MRDSAGPHRIAQFGGKATETKLQDQPLTVFTDRGALQLAEELAAHPSTLREQVLDYLHDLLRYPAKCMAHACQPELRVRNLDLTVHLSDNRHPVA